ncbi:MAG: AI-2E family transporter [Halarchaeum sp.]
MAHDSGLPALPDRDRAAWWVFLFALGGLLVYVGASLIGTFVVGVFVYYGVRPVQRRVESHVPSQGLAATVTLVLTALPFVLVTTYFGVVAYGELAPKIEQYRQFLAPYVDVNAVLNHPLSLLYAYVTNPDATRQQALQTVLASVGVASNWLANAGLALLVTFTLLRDGHRLRDWFRGVCGGDGPAFAYANAVDRDLEVVYFSNVLLVGLVAIASEVVFEAYNVVAPPAVQMPFPTVLALMMGLASLIPLVVGKVVYVPLVGYLLWAAAQANDALFVFPLVLLVVSFVLLDFVPMTFVLPEIAGRRMGLRVELVMFGYVVGTLLLGWYGLFLGPLAVVVVTTAVRYALGPLVRRESLPTEVDEGDPLDG